MGTIILINETNKYSQEKLFNKTILEHLVGSLSEEGFSKVYVGFDEAVVKKETTKRVVVIEGDMPLVNQQVIEKIREFHIKEGNDVSQVCAKGNEETGVYMFEPKILLEVFSSEAYSPEKGIDASKALAFLDEEGYKFGRLNYAEATTFSRASDAVGYCKISEQLKAKINFSHMKNGVKFVDINTAYIDATVKIGEGTVIYPNTTLEGETVIGKNCTVGPSSTLTDMTIADKVTISYSVLLESEIGSETSVGPFAYVRPHCKVGSHCKVGDFVEFKNAVVGDGTKASHLTYIGDADVGKNINFGCGTVVVNYDGKNKHRTIIEDDCFIGCNTNLVSPVAVKQGAFIAAGSTITEDVPENALGIARAKQVNKLGWERPKKVEKK